MLRGFLLAAGIVLTAASAGAEDTVTADAAPGASIAVYANGLSVVKENRSAALPDGSVRVALPDLPTTLDVSSLSVRVAGAPAGTLLIRQDTLSPDSLLRRSLGREIVWLVEIGDTGAEREIRGTLVNAVGGIVVKVGDRYEALPPGRLALDQLPPGMTGGLEVAADIAVATAGDAAVQVRYTVPALSWSAAYDAALLPDASGMTLTGFYQLTNETGTDFPAARLRLVAGHVDRVHPQPSASPAPMAEMRAAVAMAAPEAQPEAASLGDVHVYDLTDPIDLPAHRMVKRVLVGPISVPVEKRYRLNGTGVVSSGRGGVQDGLRPSVSLRLSNDADGPLGAALPAGTVRVLGALAGDDDAAPAVVLGEDRIDHLPVGGEAEIRLGQAFDVTAERRVLDYEITGTAQHRHLRPYRATHEIRLKNGRDEMVTVELTDHFRGADWRIGETSIAAHSIDAASATWNVEVPAGGEAVLTYTVRVTP